jgi:hypothetical protein
MQMNNSTTVDKSKLTGRARSIANLRTISEKDRWKKGIKKGCKLYTVRARNDMIRQLKEIADLNSPEQINRTLKKFFPDVNYETLTSSQAVMFKLLISALKGQAWAVREMFDRMHGKPQEYVDMTTLGEKLNQTVINVQTPEQKVQIENSHNTADAI